MKAKLLVTLAVLAAAGYGGYTYFNKPRKADVLEGASYEGYGRVRYLGDRNAGGDAVSSRR